MLETMLNSSLSFLDRIDLGKVITILGDNLSTIQLLHFFFISYLISRLFVRYKIPELFVYWLFEKRRISLSKMTMILIFSTAGLSMIIANLITLLALLPMILLIQNELKGTEKELKRYSTMLMLAAIWGANIGGLGMLTGTPANGVFVGMMVAQKISGHQTFTFLSWLIWAIPLAALLCLCGWFILRAMFKPHQQLSGSDLRKQLVRSNVSVYGRRFALGLAGFFLFSSAYLSYIMSSWSQLRFQSYLLTVIWTLVLLYVMFIFPHRLWKGEKRSELLSINDILRNLPWKGLMWMAIGITITAILYYFGIPEFIALKALELVSAEISYLLLLLMVGLAATFLTEIVSNLVVQLALFATFFQMMKLNPAISWQMMLIITLASGCAFMTPIATPVNGLGFGASRKMSLLYMLKAGFVMNIVSAVVISLWVRYLVPVVLSWFA